MSTDVRLTYKDIATFVKVAAGGYSNSKSSIQQVEVPVIFLQNTGYQRANFQDNLNSDALCYPDPENGFILDNHNRLEGMYILAPLFGADDDEGWYKITSVTVYRDHLLNNIIDNIELQLKKTQPIPNVS